MSTILLSVPLDTPTHPMCDPRAAARAETLRRLEAELDDLAARVADPGWPPFMTECVRLMGEAALDDDALDAAWEAYRAGLTPAHLACAVAPDLFFSAPQAYLGEEVPTGISSPSFWAHADPHSDDAAAMVPSWRPLHTTLATFAGALAGAAATALLLVSAPQSPMASPLPPAWAGVTEIAALPPPRAPRPCQPLE